MAAQWYSGTTHTQIDTSHNGKCLISSVLVWKIYKWDILVRFVVWIPCDAAQCRGMWQMHMATAHWYTAARPRPRLVPLTMTSAQSQVGWCGKYTSGGVSWYPRSVCGVDTV